MAVLFVGMGVDELSMSPNLIRLVKRAVSQMSFADAKALADTVRRMKGTRRIRSTRSAEPAHQAGAGSAFLQ
jgi:phosphoenolpyruvate-protein kinase (PTS system EI component)